MALTYTPSAELGQACPDFLLPTLLGGQFGRKDIPAQTPFLVMFICNHCPYVKAIEGRLIQLGEDLSSHGVPLIAICANDPAEYPEDSFENLKRNYLAKKMIFPYLHDLTQATARKFGAVCTPDFFGYDQQHQLAYRGRLDDSWKDPARVKRRELFEAMLELKGKNRAPSDQVSSMGCSIKWVKS